MTALLVTNVQKYHLFVEQPVNFGLLFANLQPVASIGNTVEYTTIEPFGEMVKYLRGMEGIRE